MNGFCKKVVSEDKGWMNNFSQEAKHRCYCWYCFPVLIILRLQATFIVIALPLCLGVKRQSCLGIVSVAMSLPCPCLDSALPPLSPQIAITSVWTTLAIHCFVPRGEAHKVSSRFFSGRLLPHKQGRAALVVLLGASMGSRQGHWNGSQQAPLLPLEKHLRSPRWWLQRPFIHCPEEWIFCNTKWIKFQSL